MTTILTCSLYIADDGLVRAIAESNPQSNPNFVLDTSVDLTQVDPPPPPKTAAEAVARASDILSKGDRPVLGLLQLPPAWLGGFRRELAAAFDPCTNIAIGTAMLSEFDAQCAAPSYPKSGNNKSRTSFGAAGRRRCILRKYEEAIGLADFTTITTLELRYQRPIWPSVADAPIFALAQALPWGPDQLLMPITNTLPKSPLASSP
ncbi:MAG: hypothetical protein M3O46_11210 [Myxococcota bacterium]|nr:hypothetical protein [Myxococcota bacterium]